MPGAEAPDFTLEWSRGTTIRASKFWQRKPLVVITGSQSCPMFRENTAARKALIRDFGSRVNFVVVYTVEAHPNDGLSPYSGVPMSPGENLKEGSPFLKRRATATVSFRLAVAWRRSIWRRSLPWIRWRMPCGRPTAASPNCAYLIGTDGKVIAQQGLSDPAAMRAELEKLFPR